MRHVALFSIWVAAAAVLAAGPDHVQLRVTAEGDQLSYEVINTSPNAIVGFELSTQLEARVTAIHPSEYRGGFLLLCSRPSAGAFGCPPRSSRIDGGRPCNQRRW